MSHLVLRRINGKWHMFNKHTKKVEGKSYEHKEEAAIATHKRDIQEDKVFDKNVEEEHEEHPEFSKRSAKRIAIDHERERAEGKKPADEKGKGGGKKKPFAQRWLQEKPYGKFSQDAPRNKRKLTHSKKGIHYPPPGYSKDSAKEEAEFGEGKGGGNAMKKISHLSYGQLHQLVKHNSGIGIKSELAKARHLMKKKEEKNKEPEEYGDRDTPEHEVMDELFHKRGAGGDMQNMTYNKITSGKGGYGDKRDYKKIDVYHNGKYKHSTNWAKSLKEAKERSGITEGKVHAEYSEKGRGMGKGQCWGMGSGGNHKYVKQVCQYCGKKGM